MAIPITRLERWHYKKEQEIFSDLYKATGKTAWIRIPALIAAEKCTIIRTAVQISTIVESAFTGLKLTLNPYQSPEQKQYGWSLLKDILDKSSCLMGGILFGIVISPIWISIDANFYILLFTEQTKVNWIHAEAGTFDTKAHEEDSKNASSVAKHGYQSWKNQVE